MHAVPIFTFFAISINYKCVRGVLLRQQFDSNNCDGRCDSYSNGMCRLCKEQIASEDAIQASNVKHSDKMKGIDLKPSELKDPRQSLRANDYDEIKGIDLTPSESKDLEQALKASRYDEMEKNEWTSSALEWMKKPNFEGGSTSKSQDTTSASEWIQKPNFEEGSTSKYQGTSTRHNEQRGNSQSAIHMSKNPSLLFLKLLMRSLQALVQKKKKNAVFKSILSTLKKSFNL